MLRPVTYIKIEQQPSVDFPKRTTVLNFDFVTHFEANDNWRDLTNKGKITLPKNLYFRDENSKLQPLAGTKINIGGFSSAAPLFLRGDKVTIIAGYKYYNKDHIEVEETELFFTGYISKVGSKTPIELEIENNMWVLKQTPVANRTFLKTDTLEMIMQFLIDHVEGKPFTINKLKSVTTFGVFSTENETAAQALYRLQKQFGFEFYFKGNELRGGTQVYEYDKAKEAHFYFQDDIISDDLEYSRLEDITLSAIAHNTIVVENGECKDGTKKTKKQKLEVLVTIKHYPKIGELPYTIREIKRDDVKPENTEGERREFFFPTETTVSGLAVAAYEQLKKFNYTGFKGGFTTFGLPFMKQGDTAILSDEVLPERNGRYRIKSVEYTGGVDGLRQIIKLDYKL